MVVYINDNNLVTIIKPKSINIDLLRKINESIKDHIKVIVSRYESLAEFTIKTWLDNYFSNMDMNIKNNLSSY